MILASASINFCLYLYPQYGPRMHHLIVRSNCIMCLIYLVKLYYYVIIRLELTVSVLDHIHLYEMFF